MSAYLDKSQGITFVYSNIYELYKKAKNSNLESPFTITKEVKVKPEVKEFKPAELHTINGARTFAVPMGVREAEEKALRRNIESMRELKKNMDSLSTAHEKLRFLLQELESLTKK